MSAERPIPGLAALIIGQAAIERPGLLSFMRQVHADGFGINQPGDDDLTEDEWEHIAATRARILVAAFRRSGVSS